MDSLITRYSAVAWDRMGVSVKRILKQQVHPPDLSDAAVQTVIAQAEALPRPPPV